MNMKKDSLTKTSATLSGILILGMTACQHHQYQTFPKKDIEPTLTVKEEASVVEHSTPRLSLEEAIEVYQQEISSTNAVLNKVAVAQGEEVARIDVNDNDQVLPLSLIEERLSNDTEAQQTVMESMNEPQLEQTVSFAEQPSLEQIPDNLLKAILILKKIRSAVKTASAPVETDLDYSPVEESVGQEGSVATNNSPSQLRTLTTYLESYGVDLSTEARTNFYLKQLDAFNAVKEGISLISPTLLSPEEKELVAALGITDTLPETAESTEEGLDASPETKPGIDMNAFANDDEKLAKAQRLGKQGDLSDAIDVLSSISEDSALYDPAQALLKSFSDKGVQELRRLAAQAFQSALPLNNAVDQLEYFKTAKNYLEEAKVKFPDSTQISIVENNLKMINRKIEQSQVEPTDPE